MPDKNHCPQCGTPLPFGALAGLCPACLLKMGAAADTVTDAKQKAFVPPSVAELAAKFSQLEILELVGKGGMGAVYKARQKQLDRIVALKILPPGIGDEPAFAERFAREAQALAKLNHPNIVTLYEFGNASGQFYFLMEFVDGVNLRQLLAGNRIAPREALAIVPQICDALQFAHDQGIVHRDIKPENILLDRRGRVKVADFGLAKIIEPGRAELPIGQNTEAAPQGPTGVMGTPNYMSPEQISAPGEVDHRADIYALGVVFYQMLTGELPGKKIAPPSTKVHIDVRLDEIVLRALEKKPELRYQQVSEVKTCVETITGTPGGNEKTEAGETKTDGWKYSPRGTTPFTSVEVREISAHMTAGEKLETMTTGRWFGIWNAATFFLPMACLFFIPIPVPLNWIIASLVLLVGLAGYPLWWRKMANQLCATAWAKERGYNPATLRIFPFGSTGIMLWGVVWLAVVSTCWWQTYRPDGVWLPWLSEDSIKEAAAGDTSIQVTEVSQCRQTVLIRIICDKIPHGGELAPVFAGPLIELPYVLPAAVTNVDCLLMPAPHTYVGKTIVGTNVLSGKPGFLLGFMLPDEQAAAAAVKQVKKLNLGKRHGVESPLFVLRRNLGKDANGKPIYEEIICWIGMQAKAVTRKSKSTAQNISPIIAVQNWLALADAGDYSQTWDTAAASFRADGQKDAWVKLLEKVRQPLGQVISRKEISTQTSTALSGMPDGSYFVAQFETSFAALPGAVETVEFMQEKDGQWRAIYYLIRPRTAEQTAAVTAAQKWLAGIDGGNYAQSWVDASDYFQGALTQDKWIVAMESVRKPLGELKIRTVDSAVTETHLPGTPDGKYVVMQFETAFSKMNSATETVTFSLETDGAWKACGYYIK